MRDSWLDPRLKVFSEENKQQMDKKVVLLAKKYGKTVDEMRVILIMIGMPRVLAILESHKN